MIRPSCVIQIFAKAPVKGTVKTRLIPELGEGGAELLYRQLLHTVVSNMNSIDATDVQLWIAGDIQHEFILGLSDCYGVELRQQCSGGLGDKMMDALQQGAISYPHTILIGADCVAINEAYIRQALHAVERNNSWVIGPAEDGGFVLIARAAEADALLPEYLNHVPWGEDSVLADVLTVFNRQDISCAEISCLWDVDTAKDLLRLNEVSLASAELTLC